MIYVTYKTHGKEEKTLEFTDLSLAEAFVKGLKSLMPLVEYVIEN